MTYARDIIYWYFCAALYHLYLWWPVALGNPMFILPHVGMYAYSETFEDFCVSTAWNRAGRPEEPTHATTTTD